MKFVAVVAAVAGLAAAQDKGPGPNPNLAQILNDMDPVLVAAMQYFPESFIKGIMDGTVWLPTNADDMLAKATSLPPQSSSIISSKYVEFISKVSSLLPTPTGKQDDDTDAPTPTGSVESSSSKPKTTSKSSSDTKSKPDAKSDSSEDDSSDTDTDTDTNTDTNTDSGAAALSGGAAGEDLLQAAGTATDIKSLQSAMSSNWASVYYQVNVDLNDYKYLGSPGQYESATSLYGTTELPITYDSAWVAEYASNARATVSHAGTRPTTTSHTSTRPTTTSHTSTRTTTTSHTSESGETSDTSDTSGAAVHGAGAALLAAAAAAAALL
ncbi:hypothetical protein H4R18_000262 [Coemansia javaensis]|uniref:Cell wall protein n=1 Tax=Coemansia javaensis TaxID=2761396 RepID=A0A9W8LM05_9FUNG|nr:hypothetical protein H4R18_000262 [Coemansia javaensis]